MNNDLREDVFDTVLASAFAEYVDGEMEALPSKEELDKMYPAPKNGLRKIKRTVKNNRPKSRSMVYFQRVAVVFLVAVTLFTGVMALSTEVRSTVFDTIVQWFDKFARISFGEEPVVPAKMIENVGDFEIGYVPEGLELVSSEENEDSVKYMYTNVSGDYMLITIYFPDVAMHSSDIELSQYDKIYINNNESYIFYNEDENSGSLIFENNGYTVFLSCMLDKSELIKAAENIR